MSLILSGTDGLSDVDGSAATPAIRGTDANTGIFFPAADTIAFAEGGVEAMRITSAGELILGGTSALLGQSGSLVIEGNNAAPFLSLFRNDTSVSSGNGLGVIRFYGNDTTSNTATVLATITAEATAAHAAGDNPTALVFGTTAAGSATVTERARIDSSGNLLVGNTAQSGTANRVAVFSANKFGLSIIDTTAQATGVGGALNLGGNYRSAGDAQAFARVAAVKENSTDANYAYGMAFSVTPNGGTFTEAGRFDSSGSFIWQDTTSSITSGKGVKFVYDPTNPYIGLVQASSTSANNNYHLYSTGAGAFRFFVDLGGTIHATSTSIAAISDASLKTNIKDLETGLTEVMALKPRRFDWINGDATNVAGFIAQEVEPILPELVMESMYSYDEDGNEIKKKNLKMGDILPTLVKAIQEQQALITQLTARITALESA
jgi:hypothetical protein